MKIAKLLENIAKGKLENDTKIKVDNGIEIVYRCDDEKAKHYFRKIVWRVSRVGKKLRVRNELKDLNEAYEFYKKSYR